jgi:hypothetical protein
MCYWYVSYFYKKGFDSGFGGGVISTDDEIFNPMSIADDIAKERNFDSLVIMNWKSLKESEI